MKIILEFFEFFFLDCQHNFSINKNKNSKFMVQKLSTNGSESHLKLQSSVKFFFPTLNANIFQIVLSNFMEFLPHDLIQVKYKIL